MQTADPDDAGIIVAWLGLALRLWAIASLGAAFRTTIEVYHDQRVVTARPYRWVRHPSYTGMLIVTRLVPGVW